MGEPANLGGKIVNAIYPHEFTVKAEDLPQAAVRAAQDEIQDALVHGSYAETELLLEALVGILGPAILEAFTGQLLRRSRPMFMGLHESGELRKIFDDQRAQRIARVGE